MSVARANSRATRVLVMSRGAGSITPEIEQKLRKAFADHLIVDFDPKVDLSKIVSPQARIVVVGGDGSVEFIVRKFADSQHPIGIIPVGTFNNLAHSLGLADDLDKAIDVARNGTAKAITLGRINDHFFVEACAIGLFGETIAFGDSVKDREFGALPSQLKNIVAAKPFRYQISGDFEGTGTAMSLVFSNTASIGSQLPIGDKTPIRPYLEFSVHAGRTRWDIVRRWFASTVLRKHRDEGMGQVFNFHKLEVKTTPRVRVYADNFHVGRTPATVTAEVSALRVLLPS